MNRSTLVPRRRRGAVALLTLGIASIFAGLADIERTLQHRSWLELPPDGMEFVTHDAQRGG